MTLARARLLGQKRRKRRFTTPGFQPALVQGVLARCPAEGLRRGCEPEFDRTGATSHKSGKKRPVDVPGNLELQGRLVKSNQVVLRNAEQPELLIESLR